LAYEDGLGDAKIYPGLRYAIFKITNAKMTAHKGRWGWIAQEVDNSEVNSRSSLAFDPSSAAGGMSVGTLQPDRQQFTPP
jgi:hypothetical protein